jgi:hypothetical protein
MMTKNTQIAIERKAPQFTSSSLLGFHLFPLRAANLPAAIEKGQNHACVVAGRGALYWFFGQPPLLLGQAIQETYVILEH